MSAVAEQLKQKTKNILRSFQIVIPNLLFSFSCAFQIYLCQQLAAVEAVAGRPLAPKFESSAFPPRSLEPAAEAETLTGDNLD